MKRMRARVVVTNMSSTTPPPLPPGPFIQNDQIENSEYEEDDQGVGTCNKHVL